MKYVITSVLLLVNVFADIEITGHVGLQGERYLQLPHAKHQSNMTAFESLELFYEDDAWQFKTAWYAQQDYDDFSNKRDNDRTFVRLEELYASYERGDSMLFVGRNIRFWGALEVRNIVDVFNPVDLRSDIFDTDKMGAWNVAYTYYSDNSEWSVMVKLYEENHQVAAYPYAYYLFPPFVAYDDVLQSERSRYRPSIYVSYATSFDWEYPLDSAVILENGYDSQRYFLPNSALEGSRTVLQEHAYLVNKIMSYNTMVVDATLLKLELLYSNVIEDKYISDYYHIGAGLEYTLTFDEISGDVGLIGEYYRYGTFDNDKFSDLDLYETFQNDLFLGVRYTFNDVDDSSLVGGVIRDLAYNEKVYYVEYESRFGDAVRLNLDYRYIDPSSQYQTAYALLGTHERLGLKLSYYF